MRGYEFGAEQESREAYAQPSSCRHRLCLRLLVPPPAWSCAPPIFLKPSFQVQLLAVGLFQLGFPGRTLNLRKMIADLARCREVASRLKSKIRCRSTCCTLAAL